MKDMKALLLSFFAAILCYALFFERRETPVLMDETKYTIQTEAFDTLHVSDPVILYTENFHTVYFDFPE